MCALCPGSVLDPLGHHVLTCKRGGDVVSRHNKLRWRQEATSPLTIATPAQLTSWYPTGLWASQWPLTYGAAARATELRKHEANDGKCRELGWVCVPMVVEAYGAWGAETMESLSCLASRLATSSNKAKAAVLNSF